MYETIFSFSGLIVLPFWALMILAPGWSGTWRVIRSPLIALPPALLYAALVLPGIRESFPVLLNPTLEEIARLLGQPEGATIAWIHFLVFDLFVGRWAYLDARERGMPVLVSSPVLFLVLMFGPLGFLVHLLARNRWPLPEEL